MSGEHSIGDRKAQHLEICSDDSQYQVEGGSTGLDGVRFIHRSLPEVNEDEIRTDIDFLGTRVRLPLFISSMTGGSSKSYQVNKLLAEVAQQVGIPVGMGSIRILFRKPEVTDHFRLKEHAPDVPVFANIGGVQLINSDNTQLIDLLHELAVDGVAVHLNPGQELAQPEGDRAFRGVLEGVQRLCSESPVPVLVKETGFGIAPWEAESLLTAGAAYVDVAGSGGTNWITVERYRLHDDDARVAAEFSDWGTPTGPLLQTLGHLRGRILASGGVRTGVDIAKCVALGAHSVGMALPFVRAVQEGGVAAGVALATRLARALRYAMVMTGSATLDALREAPLLRDDRFRSTVEQLEAARAAIS
jgi:isopentenyl-diphosphate delta-isomerase type 2